MLRKDLTYGAVGKNGNYRGETAKSHERRVREGWYERYAPKHLSGIDIGCGIDPIYEHFYKWDTIFGDGDATYMDSIPDNQFSTVIASHILEHLEDPIEAIRNWWRILKPGGWLVVIVPHRDLYEKRKELPSQWNGDHKWFWLPLEFDPPHTLSLSYIMSVGTNKDEILTRVLDEGYIDHGPGRQPGGEYSIEALVRK